MPPHHGGGLLLHEAPRAGRRAPRGGHRPVRVLRADDDLDPAELAGAAAAGGVALTLALSCAARTDPGRVRDHNEDAVLATPRLAAVADGVGGHAAGEVASQVAIGAIASLEKRWLEAPLAHELAAAVRDGNERIGFIASCRPAMEGMATTLTAVALREEYVVANIGDSRTYLLRDGALEQLTRDDSYLQM